MEGPALDAATAADRERRAGALLFSSMRGAVSLLGYGVNTVCCAMPILALAFFKRLLPSGRWRNRCDRLQNAMADLWIGVNIANQRLFSRVKWRIEIPDGLDRNSWYLILANHRSWVDILVLQRIFYRKIPFLKFFLKKELFWVPVLGQAWWALDFPFMKRYSKSVIKRHPDWIGKDLDITRKACEKFRHLPISVMSFVEGTRYSRKKHIAQQAPYRHLLRPRAGGIAYVLSAMQGRIQNILDVTIVYPQGDARFWDFVCGRIPEIRVFARSIPVPGSFAGDYARDRVFRRRFQKWLNGLWTEKDARIGKMRAPYTNSTSSMSKLSG